MAREVEVIFAEWRSEPEAHPSEAKAWLDDLRKQIAVGDGDGDGDGDAEDELSNIETTEAATVNQAQATLAALVATRDAAERARAAVRS